MDEYEVYKLLEEALGMKKIQKKLHEATSSLEKNEELKNETQMVLKQIEERLRAYEMRKE